VTPIRPAATTVSANTYAAEQRPVARSHATGLTGISGEQISRELLVSVQHLHTKHKPADHELRHSFANQQSACHLHRLFALILHRLEDPQLDVALVADVRSDRKLLSVPLNGEYAALDLGYVGPVTTVRDPELHGLH